MTFIEIIDLWSSAQALADEIGEKPATVRKWKERRRIPTAAWPALLATSTARRHRLTANVLLSATQSAAA